MDKTKLSEKEELEKFAKDLSESGKIINGTDITMEEIVEIIKEVREERYLKKLQNKN